MFELAAIGVASYRTNYSRLGTLFQVFFAKAETYWVLSF